MGFGGWKWRVKNLGSHVRRQGHSQLSQTELWTQGHVQYMEKSAHGGNTEQDLGESEKSEFSNLKPRATWL